MPPCYRSRFSASKLVAQSGATTLPDQPGHYPCLYVDVSGRLFSLRASRHSTVLDTVFDRYFAAPSECQLCPISPTDKPGNQSQECTADQNHHLSALGTAQERYQLVVPPTSSPLDCTNKSTCNPQASAVVRKVCAKTNGSALHTNLEVTVEEVTRETPTSPDLIPATEITTLVENSKDCI